MVVVRLPQSLIAAIHLIRCVGAVDACMLDACVGVYIYPYLTKRKRPCSFVSLCCATYLERWDQAYSDMSSKATAMEANSEPKATFNSLLNTQLDRLAFIQNTS